MGTRSAGHSRVNQFITVRVNNFPIGFMFDSNSKQPVVYKVVAKAVKMQGLRQGHILEALNGKRVGHMSTAELMNLLTYADFPMTFKFTDFGESPRKTRPGQIEVGVNTSYGVSNASPRTGVSPRTLSPRQAQNRVESPRRPGLSTQGSVFIPAMS